MISLRRVTPSLLMIRLTCVSAVRTDTCSRSAISGEVRPAATSATISRSRRVRREPVPTAPSGPAGSAR